MGLITFLGSYHVATLGHVVKPRAFAEYRKDGKINTIGLQPEICMTLKKTMPAIVKVIKNSAFDYGEIPSTACGAGVRLDRPLLVDEKTPIG